MTKTLLKNTFREIANSKARFISILAIIALGVGFFAGIKATIPSMYNMADEYYSQSDLMDYRLVSTVGFDKDDVKAVENLDNVTDVMPSYFADLVLKSNGNGGNGKVIRVSAAPKSYNNNKTLNTLNIKEGRLPEKKGEILVEYGSVGSSDYKIGDKVVFGSESGESNALDMVDTLEYTVVGKVESPMYISYQPRLLNRCILSNRHQAFVCRLFSAPQVRTFRCHIFPVLSQVRFQPAIFELVPLFFYFQAVLVRPQSAVLHSEFEQVHSQAVPVLPLFCVSSSCFPLFSCCSAVSSCSCAIASFVSQSAKTA